MGARRHDRQTSTQNSRYKVQNGSIVSKMETAWGSLSLSLTTNHLKFFGFTTLYPPHFCHVNWSLHPTFIYFCSQVSNFQSNNTKLTISPSLHCTLSFFPFLFHCFPPPSQPRVFNFISF